MRRKRPKPFGTRYDQQEIAIRVERMRELRGHERKWAFGLLGIKKGEYSRKAKGETPFTLWELSELADSLDAPPGWPFIDADLAEQLRRQSATLSRAYLPAPDPAVLKAAEPAPPPRRGAPRVKRRG